MDEESPERKIATQHRLIASLFSGLATALAARDAVRAKRRVASLRRTLEAHFHLEESHYFPRLSGERPDRVPDLDRLAQEHVRMLWSTEQVSVDLDRGKWEAATQVFDALHSLFESHEVTEREFIGS